MKIEYYHASKYGNGARIAEEFKRQMAVKGVIVNVHHVRDINPKEIPPVDLYLFSSPGRFGKPIGAMQHFLKKVNLPAGTRYALMVTELCPKPDSSTVRIPTDDNTDKCQRVIPIMNKILQEKGLFKIAEGKIFVTGIKGPLEENWQKEVEDFVSRVPVQDSVSVDSNLANSPLRSVV